MQERYLENLNPAQHQNLTSQDVVDWIKQDFRNNASVPNAQEDQIKSLLKYGDKMLKELKQNVDLSTAT